MSKPLAYKGEAVDCPRCGAEIGVLTKDMHDGDLLSVSAFAFTHKQYGYGDKAECFECRASWSNKSNGYTSLFIRKAGWV